MSARNNSGRGGRGGRRGARGGSSRGGRSSNTIDRSGEAKIKAEKSPITGVDMLVPTSGTKETSVNAVMEQLANKCIEQFGEVGSFLKTGEYFERAAPEINWAEIEAMPVVERKRERRRAEKKLTSYDDKCANDEDALPKIFGMMCQILSNESKETLSTGENYDAIMEGRGDPNSLRELIISTHTAPRVGSALMARMAVQERLRTIKQAKDETLVDYRTRVTNAVESFTVHGLDEPDEAEVAVLYLRGLKTSFKLYVSRRMQMANDGAAAIPTNLADAHSQVLLYQSSAQFYIDQTQLKSIARSGEKSKPQGRAAYSVTTEGVVEQPQKGAVKGNCNICGDSGHHGANCHHAAAFRQFMKMKESQDEYVVMKKPKEEANTERKPPAYAAQSRGRGSRGRGRGSGRGSGRPVPPSSKTAAAAYGDDEDEEYWSEYDEQGEDYDDYDESEDDEYEDRCYFSSYVIGPKFLSDGCVLLDNQSNVHLFRNRKLLTNVKKLRKPITVSGVGGELKIDKVGTLCNRIRVHYSPKASVNILSYALLTRYLFKQNLNPIYTTDYGWEVNLGDGILREFVENRGLHSCDFQTNTAVYTTVRENESKYSKREVKKAQGAVQLIENLNYPTHEKVIKMLNHGRIQNCAVTAKDVRIAENIYGKLVPALKGKSVNRKAKRLLAEDNDAQKAEDFNLRFHCDVVDVRNKHYLFGVLEPIGQYVIKRLKGTSQKQVLRTLRDIATEVENNGFSMTCISTDNDKTLAAAIKQSGLRVKHKKSGSGSHESTAERCVRTMRERLRCLEVSLPFGVPDRLLTDALIYVVDRINCTPNEKRVDEAIPMELYTGKKLDAKNELKMKFGDYVQAFDKYAVDEKKEERTRGAIALGPKGNSTGTWRFFSIRSQRVIEADYVTPLPMPDTVVRVLNMMKRSDERRSRGEKREAKHQGDTVEERETGAQMQPQQQQPAVHPPVKPQNDDFIRSVLDGPRGAKKTRALDAVRNKLLGLGQNDQPRRSTRLAKKYGYVNLSVSEAIRKHQQVAVDSLRKELSQMHKADAEGEDIFKVWKPIHDSHLSSEQRRNMVYSSVFMKEKTDAQGNFTLLKSRLVAAEIKKRFGHLVGPEGSSPTVDFASVMSIATIAHKENRRILSFDVKGAYLNCDMKRTVLMRLSKEVSSILCDMYPVYRDYLCPDGTLVVRLLRALYGTLDAGRLWNDKISEVLERLGYVRNPHDRCVYNKFDMNGTQCTVLVHVDDGLATSESEDLLKELVDRMNEEFGEVNLQEGPIVDYLGIKIDLNSDKGVFYSQIGLAEKILKNEKVAGMSLTPAGPRLLHVSVTGKEAELLAEEDRTQLHSTVYALQHLALRTRPDLLLTVNFLSTRVTKATNEDKKKLMKALKYLNYTKDMRLCCKCDEDILQLYAYIDASFGAHADGKGQSGSMLTLKDGAIYAKSSRQKITTKSSAECEAVALSDLVGQAVYMNNFLKAQGYDMKPVIIYQDNKSVIEVTKRGQNSTSRTKHIAIRFNFIRDYIASGDIEVRYMPTEKMIADIFTKPLQGKEFEKNRDSLMNCR